MLGGLRALNHLVSALTLSRRTYLVGPSVEDPLFDDDSSPLVEFRNLRGTQDFDPPVSLLMLRKRA